MKNISKIILVFLLGIFLVSCGNSKKDFESDYQMFKDIEHVYIKSNYKTVYNTLTNEEGYSVILFAYNPLLATCPYCLLALPIINEVALEEEIEEILYLDIRQMRVDRTEEYISLLNYISEQVDDLEVRNDLKEIIVPDLYIVRDGKIIGHHIATLKDDEGNYILNLSDDELLELKDVYRNLFQKTKS